MLEVLNTLAGNTNNIVTETTDNGVITVEVLDQDGLVSYYLSKYKSDRNLIPVPLGRRITVIQGTVSRLNGRWKLDGTQKLDGIREI